MLCMNCGKKLEPDQKFCFNCGASLLKSNPKESKALYKEKTVSTSHKSKKPLGIGKIIKIILFIVSIGFGAYASLDEESITQNNEGLSSFASGDSQTAIARLQAASNNAITGDTKLNTLKNLGYVYSSEEQLDQALQSFIEALTYTNKGSFEYNLVSGEIALLESKPDIAQLSFENAYNMRPNDFQINNSLALFYLDLNGVAPYYSDYKKALQHAQRAYDFGHDLVKNTTSQNLGMAHFFNENYDQAISLFSYSDVNAEPYIAYWLGWSYAAKGDEENAKIYFQKVVDAGIEMEQEAYDYLSS